MRIMSAVDQLFLLLESRKQPMHVGGLCLFELPEDACHPDSTFVYDLARKMQTATMPPTFPFNLVLENLICWKEDDQFDVEHHFRHVALPSPGRVRELLMYVSKEHSRLLDRAMPLWECHIIEGILPEHEGGPERFALYFKIHHSLVDGIAGMRIIKKAFSHSPTESMTSPIWASLDLRETKSDKPAPSIFRTVSSTLKHNLYTVRPVFTELMDNFKHQGKPDYVGTFDAPRCILNQRISASRRIVAQSYDIKRFYDIADTFNMNQNDVVLAVCAGAIRRYLLNLNELPKKPLIGFVPMSLRSDESASGNQISFLMANLGTHLKDPVKRMQLIHDTMNSGKRRFRRMNKAQIINYSAVAYAWEGLNVFTGLFPKKQAFNLIISNVPGSKDEMYWDGAKLKALYPASILVDGQALNITLASYMDKIEFCFTACSKILPRVQDILVLLEEELSLLENICEEKRLGVRH